MTWINHNESTTVSPTVSSACCPVASWCSFHFHVWEVYNSTVQVVQYINNFALSIVKYSCCLQRTCTCTVLPAFVLHQLIYASFLDSRIIVHRSLTKVFALGIFVVLPSVSFFFLLPRTHLDPVPNHYLLELEYAFGLDASSRQWLFKSLSCCERGTLKPSGRGFRRFLTDGREGENRYSDFGPLGAACIV